MLVYAEGPILTPVRPPDSTHPRQCSMHTPSAVGAPYEANLHTQFHIVCAQLLSSKPQQSTRWYASQWQAIGQLCRHTNHHCGTWVRRAQNWPCGGYAELAPKVKLQGR